MKPFDLQKALDGEPVVMRDGRKVTQLHVFMDVDDKYCVAGVVNGRVHAWTKGGSFCSHQHDFDLFMAEKKKVKREAWVNMYPMQSYLLLSVIPVDAAINPTKESADINAAAGRIACCRIEWEEDAQ